MLPGQEMSSVSPLAHVWRMPSENDMEVALERGGFQGDILFVDLADLLKFVLCVLSVVAPQLDPVDVAKLTAEGEG